MGCEQFPFEKKSRCQCEIPGFNREESAQREHVEDALTSHVSSDAICHICHDESVVPLLFYIHSLSINANFETLLFELHSLQ